MAGICGDTCKLEGVLKSRCITSRAVTVKPVSVYSGHSVS